jgi:hypothetical protein
VTEDPPTGKVHRDLPAFRFGDDLGIPHASPGLDDRPYPRLPGDLDAIGEWEKSIGLAPSLLLGIVKERQD